MSTRCHIALYEKQNAPSNSTLDNYSVLLYRHCDGYPGSVTKSGRCRDIGVLSDIVTFLHRFNRQRGVNDVEYAGAWLMHHLLEIHVKDMRKFVDANSVKKDGKDFLGHGVCQKGGHHGDIEYFYAIFQNPDNYNEIVVHVFEANLWDDVSLRDGLKLAQTIRINTENEKPLVHTEILRASE
jgi:hypothetical protein